MTGHARMKILLFIAVGGALGALGRYGLSTQVYIVFGRAFPYGTLAVNVIGSLLAGLLYVLVVERLHLNEHWHAGLSAGFLGALTTFSAFSVETIRLLETGEPVRALINVTLSIALCLTGCWLGLLAGRAV